MMKVKLTGSLEEEFAAAIEREADKIREKALAALIEATPYRTGEAQRGWRLENGAFVNDVDHISDLNAGTSLQAPSHFIESTLLSIDGILPNGIIVTEK